MNQSERDPAGALSVLHVSETLSGGVLQSLSTLAVAQARAGFVVIVAYARRLDTAGRHELQEWFPGVELIEFGGSGLSVRTVAGWIRQVRQIVRERRPDVVHAHSSVAGGFVRLAACLPPRFDVVYSPHGFAFLRRDVSAVHRFGFRQVERLLARCGSGLILVSASERDEAVGQLRARRTAVLENCIDLSTIPEWSPRMGGRLTVAIPARLTYAKAPWRFAETARQFADRCEFVWIGDGEDDDKATWLGDAPVRVTGWLDQDELLKELSTVDIVLFTSLWEGMPIGLIQAQAIGIPVVATDVVGNRDVVLDGQTGFLASSRDEFRGRLEQLVSDPGLRLSLGAAARAHAWDRFGDGALGSRSRAVYRTLAAQ